MSDAIERFSNRVENYVKYRPTYPKEVLQVFRDEMNLQKSSVVADVGSGTGISARLFLENGNRVFGVEPNERMSAAAEEFLREFPSFQSVGGTAENTTLAEKSVDFVVAAQAFHWFNPENARREFQRILKSNGFAVLIWNERELEANDFLRAYERFLVKYGTDYEQTRHDNIDEKILKNFFRTDFSRKSFPNVQTLDFAGLKGRLLSASYMPTEQDSVFAAMIAELERLFADYAKDGRIDILYSTNIYYSQF